MRWPPGPLPTITPRWPSGTCSQPTGTRQLPPGYQQLPALLIEAPALSYAEISARLGIPAGSTGLRRRRCPDKLRRHPAITAPINAGTQTATPDAWPQ